MSEHDYLKNWSASDLEEGHERTIYKIGEVVQEIENLQSLLSSLRERNAYIQKLGVDNP